MTVLHHSDVFKENGVQHSLFGPSVEMSLRHSQDCLVMSGINTSLSDAVCSLGNHVQYEGVFSMLLKIADLGQNFNVTKIKRLWIQ